MYNTPPPGAGAAGVGAGGALAYTGFNALVFGVVAAVLIVVGLVVIRMSMLRREAANAGANAAA